MFTALAPVFNLQELAKKITPEIRAVAQNYEAVYLNTMLQEMYSGLETDGMFGGGTSEDIFRSMQIDEYAKSIAKSGQTPLADQIAMELVRLQEIAR